MRGYLLDTNIISELRKGDRVNKNVQAWFDGVEDSDIREMLTTRDLVSGFNAGLNSNTER